MNDCIEITKPDRTLLEFDLYYVFEEVKMNWINERKLQLRPLLQWWGTEYRRAQSESYWLNKWIESTTEVLLHGGRVVVDDARFDNEIDAIVNLGGKHVFIETADEARAERLTQRDGAVNLGIASHASEQSVDSTDPRNSLILQNKGSHFLMNLDFAVNVDF